MATKHKPIPLIGTDPEESAAQIAELSQAGEASNGFGSYLASHHEEFIARFRACQQALTSHDPERIREIGDEVRRSEAEAVVSNFPS